MPYKNSSKESFKKICQSFRLADFFIFFAILALSLYLIFRPKKKSNFVHIKANGRELLYPLDKDGIYKIDGRNGPSKIEIKDSQVRFLSSTCPNQTCVALGWGKTLICLPNDVIVSVEDGDSNLDDVSF